MEKIKIKNKNTEKIQKISVFTEMSYLKIWKIQKYRNFYRNTDRYRQTSSYTLIHTYTDTYTHKTAQYRLT